MSFRLKKVLFGILVLNLLSHSLKCEKCVGRVSVRHLPNPNRKTSHRLSQFPRRGEILIKEWLWNVNIFKKSSFGELTSSNGAQEVIRIKKFDFSKTGRKSVYLKVQNPKWAFPDLYARFGRLTRTPFLLNAFQLFVFDLRN